MMASPRSGTECSLIAPQPPTEPVEADAADPGEAEAARARQLERAEGRYGRVQAPEFKPPSGGDSAPAPSDPSWIEVALVDDDDAPVSGEPFEVTLPDGSIYTGTTDAKGMARVDGFDPGQCKVRFPKLDESVVKEA